MLCVGTPSQANGNIDLSYLRRVCDDISVLLRPRAKRLVITVRSTVFPGTCESLLETVFAHSKDVDIVSNPEFLREGTAVKDFMEPSLLVVGEARMKLRSPWPTYTPAFPARSPSSRCALPK